MRPSSISSLAIIFMGAVIASSALPTGDFLFSRFFDGESNCTVPATGTYGAITPLGCIVSGSKSQLGTCNGTHYVVQSCSDTACSSDCTEISTLPLNECESASIRTCEPISEELFPTNALIKVAWEKPGDCDRSDFSAIWLYGEDNECFNTNSSFTEFFDFNCNSSTGALTRSFHSSPWCDGAVRKDQPTNDQVCLSTVNDQYSSNTLIGCNLAAMFGGLQPRAPTQPAPVPAGMVPPSAPVNNAPATPATPTSFQPNRLGTSSASHIVAFSWVTTIWFLL